MLLSKPCRSQRGNKFNLMLQKDPYPYKYMDDWKKLNQIFLPKNEEFACNFKKLELKSKIITVN